MIKRKFEIEPEKEIILRKFADLVCNANRHFNITGLKNKTEIYDELVVGSIRPVSGIIVPRGTVFVDIGTGAGVPGIPLGIYFENLEGVLIESSIKKAGFIKNALNELHVESLKVECERAEEVVKRPGYREAFDWVFARAFQDIYITLEMASAFVKINGYVYVYAVETTEAICGYVKEHYQRLGLDAVELIMMKKYGVEEEGFLFRKCEPTPLKYPRRFAVIKRESRYSRERKEDV